MLHMLNTVAHQSCLSAVALVKEVPLFITVQANVKTILVFLKVVTYIIAQMVIEL